MAEAVKDVTTTEEVAVDLVAEEAQVVLEVKEAEAEKEEAQEVLVQEVAETEVHLQDVKVVFHQTDRQKKADLEVKELQLQEENQVRLKEKKDLQEDLKELHLDQQVAHLTKQKLEDQEGVNYYFLVFKNKSQIILLINNVVWDSSFKKNVLLIF